MRYLGFAVIALIVAWFAGHANAAQKLTADKITHPTLTGVALECYKQALTNDDIFQKNKEHSIKKPEDENSGTGENPDDRQYTPTVELENMATKMCTYSDAPGALKCYRDTFAAEDVLPEHKGLNILLREKEVAKFCSNSYGRGFNKATGDIDAIDCYRGVMADPEVLANRRPTQTPINRERDVIRLCISSNAKGAITCFKNAFNDPKNIYAKRDYRSKIQLEDNIITLCRAQRLR